MKKPTSIRKLKKRIKLLNNLDLQSYKDRHSELIQIIRKSFNVFCDIYSLPAACPKPFFRACICEPDNAPFKSIKRIAYNPNTKDIGRTNLKNKSIAYAAVSLDNAAIEASQYYLRTSQNRIFFITIGEWEIVKDLNAYVVCHSKKAQMSGTDLYEIYLPLRNERKNTGITNGKLLVWELINSFWADQYAKQNITCNEDYLFSALHSNTLLNSKNVDCILYPSQAYQYKGFNISYRGVLVDNKWVKLKRVHHVKIVFKEYPHIETINMTDQFDSDTIIW